MTGIAKISTSWPPMRVTHVSKGLSITDREDGSYKLTLPDGTILEGVLRIDPTHVKVLPNQLFPLHWMVDRCEAYSPEPNEGKPSLSFSLEPEPCDLVFEDECGHFVPHMVARAIKAEGKVMLLDGSVGIGWFNLPEANSYYHFHLDPKLRFWLVDQVPFGPPPCPQADGEVAFQDPDVTGISVDPGVPTRR
jgi:hypothetical protein